MLWTWGTNHNKAANIKKETNAASVGVNDATQQALPLPILDKIF